MALPEITERVALTLPDGSLDRRSVGWARQPLVDTSGVARDGLRRWTRHTGRNKRWEYWGVVTPTHVLALTVSSLDYAAVHEVWVLDRETGRTFGATATVVPARGVELPGSLGDGPARARAKTLAIDVDEVDGGTRLRARTRDVSFDVVAELPPGHERLAVVVPWSDSRFQYTVKDVARPTHGTLWVDGRTVDVPAGSSTHNVPSAGRATSLTVYWNRVSLHGTTTASRSCPGGSAATRSNETSRVRARRRVPPSTSSRSIARFFARARAGPSPSVPGSSTPRAGTTVAAAPHVRPDSRSRTHTSCTAA